jgi:hypothetical protein
MSDEKATRQSAGRQVELPGEDVAILAAIAQARRASADGRVCSLDEARRKMASEPRTERNGAQRSEAQ